MPAGAGLLDYLGPHRTPRRVDGPLTRVRAALLWTSLRGPAVSPDRREVDLARPLLVRLEALLLSEAPVYARGMAGLELLLTDGVGCAYAPAYPGQLLDELEGLGLALERREEGW